MSPKISKDTMLLTLSQKLVILNSFERKWGKNIFWAHNSKEKFSSKLISEVIFFEVLSRLFAKKDVHGKKNSYENVLKQKLFPYLFRSEENITT